MLVPCLEDRRLPCDLCCIHMVAHLPIRNRFSKYALQLTSVLWLIVASQCCRSLRQCRTDLFDSLLTAPQTEDADETSQQHYQNIQGGDKQVRVPHLQRVHHVLVHVKPAKHVSSVVT